MSKKACLSPQRKANNVGWSKARFEEAIKNKQLSIGEVLKKAKTNPASFEGQNKEVIIKKMNRDIRDLKKRM